MRRFLKEIWELWYWAMCCPLLLQQRMNEWAPKTDSDTNFTDILSGSSMSWRFSLQTLWLIGIFSLPLIRLFVESSINISWLLLPATLVVAYGLATLFLPLGINIPLLVGGLCWVDITRLTENLRIGFNLVEQTIPHVSQFVEGIGTSILLLGCVINVVYALLKLNERSISRILFVICNTFVVSFGGWISTQSVLFTLLLGITIGFFSYSFQDQLGNSNDALLDTSIIASGIGVVVACVTAFSVAIMVTSTIADRIASLVAIGVMGIVVIMIARVAAKVVASIFENITLFKLLEVVVGATSICLVIIMFAIMNMIVGPRTSLVLFVIVVGVDGVFTGLVVGIITFLLAVVVVVVTAVVAVVVVASISALPLAPFLLATIGVVFSFSSSQKFLWSMCLSGVFMILGAENLGWQVLWVMPVSMPFYYRLLPDYLLFISVLITASLNFLSKTTYMKRLPPYTSELLWLPIPGHAQLLVQVFSEDLSLGLATLQSMQSSALPGLKHTAIRALPDIVVSQLLQVEDIPSIQAILPEVAGQQSENLFKILLPTYYETQLEENKAQQPSESDLDQIFPRFQNIAQNIDAALQANNYALRERGLERILDQLKSLKLSLPSLGLKSNEIRRWQPVITRWKNILELELKERQKLSQAELVNPFQYGNPLKRSQSDLFKGRQHFADNIVRLLLDRNRPTIVLHGPRRCGKTSFLNNLPRLLPSDWLPIFVDIQSSAATADEISFLRSLARAIHRDSRSQGLQLPTAPERNAFLEAPYDTFETWLDKVRDQLGDRQLLLNLDEFEKIGTAITQGKLSLSIFNQLRSLIQHWEQLGFIFSGVQTLDEIGPNWSSYFIGVIPVEMLYLEPDEARDLLTNPDPEFALTYASGLVDTILDLTQCHPNLLQLLGAALVTEANERHTQTATADMLEAAIPRAFTLGTSYFTNVWTEFTGDPTKAAEVRAGQRALKALADNIQPIQTDTSTKAALRRMVRYHVLKVDSAQYQFDIPLIKRWVKERAILDELT